MHPVFRYAPSGDTSLIGVIGNAVADLSCEASALQRSGETMLVSAPNLDTGEKELNQAIVSHRSGSRVRVVATIGDDAAKPFCDSDMNNNSFLADTRRQSSFWEVGTWVGQ